MAHIEDGSGGREIAVEPNIVPFIDLMSVLIIFLLITAVWTQVSMIQIGSSVYGKKQESVDDIPPPPLFEVAFRLDVLDSGYQVYIDTRKFFVAKTVQGYDQKLLIERLKEIKQEYPDKRDAVITILDELPYGELIAGMDALLISGFPQISVSTSGAQ